MQIDRTLFRFELKALLLNRLTLFQTVFLQWFCAKTFLDQKTFAVRDALFWTNYGLFVGTAVALMLGGICVGYLLVKPRANGMVELMLASPLSLRKLIATTLAVCFLFSAANLGLHLLVLKAYAGLTPYGAGFYLAVAAALALALLALFGAVIFSLRSRDANQLHAALLITGMLFFGTALLTGLRLQVPLWLPPALTAGLLLGTAALWRSAPGLVTKEQAVLA